MREDAVAKTSALHVAARLIALVMVGCSRRVAASAPGDPAVAPPSSGPSGASEVVDGGHDAPDAAPTVRSSEALRVLPLGDSITDGEKLPGGWRPELKRACAGVTIDFVGSLQNGPPGFEDREHEGHVGWTIDRVAARAEDWARLARPDVVMLMLGTNDVAIGSRLDSAPARLAAMVRVIHAAAPRARLLVSTLPPLTRVRGWQDRVDRFNEALPGALEPLRSEGAPVAVVHVGDVLDARDLRDGVHPSEGGNALLGRAWCEALEAEVSDGGQDVGLTDE